MALHATTCRAAVAYIAPCHQMKQQLFFRKLANWQLRNEWRANTWHREFPHWFTAEA